MVVSAQITTIILIFLLAFIPNCSSSFLSRVICITPTTVTNETVQDEGFKDNNCKNSQFQISESLTLEDALQNFTKYFTSNTKIQLLPGTHEVSEFSSSIEVRDIENFAVVGSTCTKDNDTYTMSQKCSNLKLECTGNASLEIVFINSTNVTISGIYVKNCRINRDEGFLRCYQYTFLRVELSSAITFKQMTFEHSLGACIVLKGLRGLRLCYISFINVEVSVTALDTIWFNTNNNIPYQDQLDVRLGQVYHLTNLVFMPSYKNLTIGKPFVGLKIEFEHHREFISFNLKHIILKYGNLTLIYINQLCTDVSQTIININNLTDSHW